MSWVSNHQGRCAFQELFIEVLHCGKYRTDTAKIKDWLHMPKRVFLAERLRARLTAATPESPES